MEFTGLIKVSRLPQAVLYQPFLPPCEVSLALTGHHLIFKPKAKKGKDIKILNRAIDNVEKRAHEQTKNNLVTLTVKTKHLQTWHVDISSAPLEDIQQFSDSLEKLSALEDISRSYSFAYSPDFTILEDGWNAFQLEVEHSKLVHSVDSEWRITYVNKDFSVCRSYPKASLVPISITDDQIRNAAQFRQGGRFPVMCYRHVNGQVIVRTSQPLCGPNSRRCRDDERILATILAKQRRGYIIDTRTAAATHSERTKGGGYELEQYYPKWRRINKSIDRYHYFLDSYSKLMDACSDTNASCDKWISKLTISSWLTHVKEILNCGCLISQMLEKEVASVVVHGSEGLDITLCVTSIAQIILNPDCRTVRGFEALIDLEWVQSGHPFWTRTSKGPFTDSVPTKSKSYSPTFILFLDCVHQIHRQFPCSFEFTEQLLIFLACEAYASNFGTFLCDSEAEKTAFNVKESTISIWSYINRPDILSGYINSVYDPNKSVIWPSVAPISLALWNNFYMRGVIDQTLSDGSQQKIHDIMERNRKAKSEVLRLRKQLLETLAEAERLGIVMTKISIPEAEIDHSPLIDTPQAEDSVDELVDELGCVFESSSTEDVLTN